ncbi:hypothetical protein C4544_06905 [candidate division WS5 bacterium]|uniref:CMP/dCMP-type deaminase domain-containing protein n=1 Tax=candidate division WS5 bacterium TaxID=2093353 RepID=A0A419DAE3_9BACT|nr:MAG: hypothetical protein C4544_06905 [candidate division WS5 bacterium]
MRILEGKELKEADLFFEKAAELSRKSICHVSKIGVVLVKSGKVIGEAFNGPLKKSCNPCLLDMIERQVKTELCLAMHAEERAVLDALEKGHDTNGADIYSVRVDEGKIVPYKNGLCASCGRVFLESGVKNVIIPKEEGVTAYDTEEFYDISFNRFIQKKFII